MMVFSFEKAAMRGEPMPRGLDIADAGIYEALKNLYAIHRRGEIERREAQEEKRRLVDSWRGTKSKIEFLDRESETLRNRIAEASEAYERDRTLDNADKLYAAFYNLPENWR